MKEKRASKKVAVVLCNLGGPDKLSSVKPFLFNLFNDKAIIGLPLVFRYLLAKIISSRREKTAQEIYSYIGGKSPILEETQAQADLLEKQLNDKSEGDSYKAFIAMRYWHPFSSEAVSQVKEYGADEVIILPLYPQFSTTTSESSIEEWNLQAKNLDLDVPTKVIGCYPNHNLFIKSHVDLLKEAISKVKKGEPYRVLFSAHGLPEKIIEKGDPYQYQVELTSNKVVEELGIKDLDWVVCYQSKVGPLEWIKPSTEDEIERAGVDNKTLIILPIAFVSEHSETLVELDIEYKELAEEKAVPGYIRVPTLSVHPDFISSLAEICINSENPGKVSAAGGKRICPGNFSRCLCS